jgi:hypothetical protein
VAINQKVINCDDDDFADRLDEDVEDGDAVDDDVDNFQRCNRFAA